MGIVIKGLTETQSALNVVRMKLQVLKTKILDRFASKVRDVAKGRVGVDTGALRESIFSGLLKASANEIVYEIVAGTDVVRRGEGRFTYSKKTGHKVSPKATKEYAEVHEGKQGYMQTAFDWANSQIDKEIGRAINNIMRHF